MENENRTITDPNDDTSMHPSEATQGPGTAGQPAEPIKDSVDNRDSVTEKLDLLTFRAFASNPLPNDGVYHWVDQTDDVDHDDVEGAVEVDATAEMSDRAPADLAEPANLVEPQETATQPVAAASEAPAMQGAATGEADIRAEAGKAKEDASHIQIREVRAMPVEKKFRLAVGYRNSNDVEELREALAETDIKLVSYDQDAQRVFDNAVRLDADVVLISPDCQGYRTVILQDLLFHRAKPIPVIGWVEARSDDGRQMTANGASGYITLPLDGIQISKFVNMLHEVVDRERKRRAQGEVSLAIKDVVPDSRQNTWQSKVVAIYVPKGGGSHRTTTAINLAVTLSHLTMGNQRTMLLDFDQTKGDAHTMLGYIIEDEMKIAMQRNLRIIERGLYDLIVNVSARYAVQGTSMIGLPLIKNYLVDSPAVPESQLDLLPGLMRPTDNGSEEFANRQMILDIGRAIIQQVRRSYAFTVVDIGQDFASPLHEAAIQEADEVLVVVPPIMTAVLDTRYALQSLERYFGDLNKFRLLVTGFDESFGLSERDMVDMLGLPLAATIPFDPIVATQAVNTHVPYVLTDSGPLGNTMRSLGGMYLPQLQDVFKPKPANKVSGFSIKRLFVRQV